MTARRNARGAFTLVELLVVIGIIGLLIAILLPTLNKAKESSRQVKCLSNLKQLANALITYTNENKGAMPAAAGGSPAYHVSGDPTRGVYDFISWHRTKDPVTGANWPGQPDLKITDSALAKFLGNSAAEEVYRCPSDDLLSRPNMSFLPALPKYRYSYSMNRYVATKPGDKPKKIGSIRNSAEIVLFICEDESTLDDGYYNPNPLQWSASGGKINAVASRHRIRRAAANNLQNSSQGNQDVLGNVAFCDGHAQIFGRKDALRQKHTLNPAADPAGF